MPINPLKYEEAGAAREIFDEIKKKAGRVPNIYAAMAHSPAALKSFLSYKEALSGGELTAQEGEAIALVVGQANDCDYCLAAHTAIARMAGIDADEALQLRQGVSPDAKRSALVQLAREIVVSKGRPKKEVIQAFHAAGYGEAALVEVISHVAANIFTNYFNHISEVAVDFPAAPAL